jgi:hypothetical protein
MAKLLGLSPAVKAMWRSLSVTYWSDEEPVRRGRNAPKACFIVRDSLQQEIRPKGPSAREVVRYCPRVTALRGKV